MKGFKKLGI